MVTSHGKYLPSVFCCLSPYELICISKFFKPVIPFIIRTDFQHSKIKIENGFKALGLTTTQYYCKDIMFEYEVLIGIQR